ncbi:hypothetical protein [Sphingopyxis sp. LK2115]|jgi:hypothetical protein|uniref:hypothetical protein n=1 Tax=Sphingopyxis sp. LK2115 TaxID=2744558 RepID=UPI001660B77C|nr:hypothetical protein [Sphingopyxis sp. LK2115]
MSVRIFGQVRAARVALAAAMLAASASAGAQDSGTATQNPPRQIDFRLQPEDDGRAPGVQGPADNGLPPVAPGERRGQPTPAPTPTPTAPAIPPRVVPTQPEPPAAPDPAAARRPAPAASEAQRATTPTPAPQIDPAADAEALPPVNSQPSAPDPVTREPADDVSAANMPSPGTPAWAWALAVLAALGAGLWYWRRRASPVGPALDDTPEAASPPPAARPAPSPLAKAATARPPAPPPTAPAPTAPAPTAPRPASPLVTRPAAERRAIVAMALEIRTIRFAADHVAVGFALNLVNQGSADATGLMVRIALNQGSAMTEPVLGRFFDGAGGSVLRDDMMLAPGAGELLSTEVMLPRAAIEPLMIGGKPMLVPVMAIDVTYHWEGEGDAFGQNAGSFVLGREQGAGSDKLAPLALDRAAYVVDRPAARPTAIRRSQ